MLILMLIFIALYLVGAALMAYAINVMPDLSQPPSQIPSRKRLNVFVAGVLVMLFDAIFFLCGFFYEVFTQGVG